MGGSCGSFFYISQLEFSDELLELLLHTMTLNFGLFGTTFGGNDFYYCVSSVPSVFDRFERNSSLKSFASRFLFRNPPPRFKPFFIILDFYFNLRSRGLFSLDLYSSYDNDIEALTISPNYFYFGGRITFSISSFELIIFGSLISLYLNLLTIVVIFSSSAGLVLVMHLRLFT